MYRVFIKYCFVSDFKRRFEVYCMANSILKLTVQPWKPGILCESNCLQTYMHVIKAKEALKTMYCLRKCIKNSTLKASYLKIWKRLVDVILA